MGRKVICFLKSFVCGFWGALCVWTLISKTKWNQSAPESRWLIWILSSSVRMMMKYLWQFAGCGNDFFHFLIILLRYQSWTQDRFQWLIINECSQDVQGSIFTRSHWLQYQRWTQALVVSIRLGSLCPLNLTATVASNYVFTKFNFNI